MSDDEADPELLDFLRQHFQKASLAPQVPETRVLEGAEYVYDNAIDVALDYQSTKAAAAMIYDQMQKKEYSTKTWAEHELHPKVKDESTVAFIFTMDLLNFSFWSEKNEEERFAVEYRGKKWTGYWSLVAALQRALDEGQFRATSLFRIGSLSLCLIQISPSHLRISGKMKMSVLKRFSSMSSGVPLRKRSPYFRKEWPV